LAINTIKEMAPLLKTKENIHTKIKLIIHKTKLILYLILLICTALLFFINKEAKTIHNKSKTIDVDKNTIKKTCIVSYIIIVSHTMLLYKGQHYI